MSVKMLITHGGYSEGSVLTNLSPAREALYVANGWAATITPTGQYLNSAGQLVNKDGTPASGGGSSASSALAKPQKKICWLGNSIFFGGNSMMQELDRLSGNRFTTSMNSGVAGAGTVYLMANMATLIDPTADIVILMEGSNDAVSAIAMGTHYNNMKTIGTYVQSLGKELIILATPVRDLFGTDTNKRTAKYPLVEWLVARDLGAIYCDPWRDFRTVIGEWPAGYTTSNDYTHPGFGDIYRAAAVRILAAIEGAVINRIPFIECISDDENVGMSSVSNLGGSGLAQGNALLQDTAGWAKVEVEANITLSVGSAAPIRGNELIIDFTAGISATRNVSRTFLNTASGVRRPISTDQCMCSAIIRGTGLSNAKFRVYHTAPNAGYSDQSLIASPRWDLDRTFFYTPIFTTSGSGAGTAYNIVVEISQINTGAPAFGTVAISNADMYNLTRMKTTNYGV